MTTIIVTETHVAADGQVGNGSYVSWSDDVKIRRYEARRGGHSGICGIAGVGCLDHLMTALDNGELADLKAKVDWTLVLVPDQPARLSTGLDNAIEYTSDYPYADPIRLPMAWGSGGLIARALMKAQVPLERIIEIVTEMDVHSGGKWTVLERR